MKVIDRIMLNGSNGIMIVCINEEYYLVSFGEKNIRMLCKLEDFKENDLSASEQSALFQDVFQSFINKDRNKITPHNKSNGEPQ